MKKFARTCLVFFVAFLVAAPLAAASGKLDSSGVYKGVKLAGRVKVVSYNANFKVKVVDSFPDLKVKILQYRGTRIGEWQFVDYNQDFTIQFVDYNPDFTIKYVDVSPGVNF